MHLLVSMTRVSFTPNPAAVLAANEQLYRVAGVSPVTVSILETSPNDATIGSLV